MYQNDPRKIIDLCLFFQHCDQRFHVFLSLFTYPPHPGDAEDYTLLLYD